MLRVGQRVKRVGGCPRAAYDIVPPGVEGSILKGHESDGAFYWLVSFDSGENWSCVPESLVPITDPKAEEFLERIRNLIPELVTR